MPSLLQKLQSIANGKVGLTRGKRPRARDLGIHIGDLPTGRLNAITDIEGVEVGHKTLISGEGKLAVRTGVTAILPHKEDIYQNPLYAATYTINGNGEMTGTHRIKQWGLEVPIVLTNTLSTPTAMNGVISHMLKQDHQRDDILPVVAECYDGGLNDIAGRHVKESHILEAIESSMAGPVDEGSVGAGTGMRAYEFKAGIGTASRVLPEEQGGFGVGVLVNANLGRRSELEICGVPVGKELSADISAPTKDGSIVIIIATNAPLIPAQLEQLCIRAIHGISRTGTNSRTTSGEFSLAFSTNNRICKHGPPLLNGRFLQNESWLNSLFDATADSTQEAILNSLCAARTMVGKDNTVMPELPLDRLVELLRFYRRIK